MNPRTRMILEPILVSLACLLSITVIVLAVTAVIDMLPEDSQTTETQVTGPTFTGPPAHYRWPDDATGLICFSRGYDSSVSCYPPAPTDQPPQ